VTQGECSMNRGLRANADPEMEFGDDASVPVLIQKTLATYEYLSKGRLTKRNHSNTDSNERGSGGWAAKKSSVSRLSSITPGRARIRS
jgi:hypothetical protein